MHHKTATPPDSVSRPLLFITLITVALAGILVLAQQFGAHAEGDKTPAKAISAGEAQERGLEQAVFGGGCFWCTEAVFEQLSGVEEVISGYAGGDEANPTYEEVAYGRTTHAEVIQITYDPAEISYEKLLEWFWKAHDPTEVDGQHPDKGRQYRSTILALDDAQLKTANASKESAQSNFDKPIATEIEKLDTFYPAEVYHQDYAKNHPANPYIQRWLVPKLKKLDLEMP